MKLSHFFMCVALAVGLVACGGGNKEPTGTAPVIPTPIVTLPTITLGLVGGGNSISASGLTAAQATVKDANGVAVAGKLVAFSGDSALIKFSPASGQVLTDASGLATVQISPVSLNSAGASTLTVATKLGTTDLTTTFDFQLASANLSLTNLSLGSGTLAAFGSRPISVVANINGTVATSVPVQLTFNASCGAVDPAIVTTDATGTATTTYTASLATCAGTNVTITASAAGAPMASGNIKVDSSVASNVLFVSTTPQLIYLKDSVGITQAQVAFKVVDSSGNPLQNKKLRFALSNTATGVTLAALGNPNAVDLTTDSTGVATIAVFAGTVPTSLNVKATILDATDNPTSIFSNSNLLTVASGRPTQKSMSLALEKLSIEAENRDGVTTQVTLSMADRQGNPVPPGTQVNFVTESGVLQPATCVVPSVTPPESSCSVTFRSQGKRTANGAVSILAYVDGEEDFVDNDGNNVYGNGDTFTDLGRAYRDDNGQSATGKDGVYNAGEFQIPRSGTNACVNAFGCTGDSIWGAADVRAQATLILASGKANIDFPVPLTAIGGDVRISNSSPADSSTYSVPFGSAVDLVATDNTALSPSACTISSATTIDVPNTIFALTVPVVLAGCTSGDVISIKVTTPLNTITQKDFLIP